jgi:RNA polymerase sigma-70 factor (ECF subfamily)
MWIQGARNIGSFMLEPTPSMCRGSVLLPTSANGCPAFAQYKPDPAGGRAPWALQVHEVSGGLVGTSVFFLEAAPLFEAFGLPARLPG